MLEFFRNIDYSTKGEVLSGFTDEVVKNILIDYYQNNLKLNEIIKKYSIHTIASNLRKEFPKVSTSFICEICDEEKYIQLPTKTDYNKLVNNDQLDNYFVQDNRCFSCGHKNNDDDCSCDYCSKEKRQKILDTYFLEEIRYIYPGLGYESSYIYQLFYRDLILVKMNLIFLLSRKLKIKNYHKCFLMVIIPLMKYTF